MSAASRVPIAFVTGASRGLGLAFVRHVLAARTHRVIASCRTPETATELNALRGTEGGDALLGVLPLDVESDASVKAAAEATRELLAAGDGIDLLLSNAGVLSRGPRGTPALQVSLDDFAWVHAVNTIGPLRLVQHFAPLLASATSAPAAASSRTKPQVVVVSSQLGSIARCTTGGGIAYRSSKAAVNMVVKTLATEADSKDRATFVAIHPGWVQTDMGNSGGRTADITTEQSINGITTVLARLTDTDSGRFFAWNGEELPW